MKIVFLDAYTNNPGDLSFEAFRLLGEFVSYDRTSLSQVYERAADAEIVIVNKFSINHGILSMMPMVRYICVAATGFNNIDIFETNNRQIQVSNVKGYSVHGVAQHLFAVLLSYINKPDYYISEVKKGRWSTTADFCFYDHSISELSGKTFGIIGYGDIGKKVTGIAMAMGMHALVHTRTIPEEKHSGINFVDLDTLWKESDVISLHCPLTSDTKEIINKNTLKLMKPDTILINIGRGGLINEDDLLTALNEELLGCAILDVLQVEPPSVNQELINHPKCLVTPHIAWASKESRQRLIDGVAGNIRSWLNGVWINRVE